jgi:hypothetical protein
MKIIRRVYFSLLSVILLTFLFGTVTYAWIQINTINSLEGLSMTATTGETLKISIDGVNYAQSLDTKQLTAVFSNVRLHDVTSMDGIHFFTGGVKDIEPALANEHYLSFDLYFQTVEPEKHVYLVNNVNNRATFTDEIDGTYVISRGVYWIANHDFMYAPDNIIRRGQEGFYFGSDAIRIATVELKNEQNLLDTRSDDELRTMIYDPSENPERGFGVYYGAFNYFAAVSGIVGFRLPTQKPPTIYSLTQFPSYDPFQALDNTSQIAELIATDEVDANGKTYYRGKIRVNIWIEGWDADAFDAVHQDILRIQLQFKLAKPYIETGQN